MEKQEIKGKEKLNTMSRSIILMITILGVLALCGAAFAIPDGEIIEGGSWSQQMDESSGVVGTYNYLQAEMWNTNTTLFEAPAFRLLPATWTVSPSTDSTFVSASGPSVAAGQNYYMWFTGNNTDVTHFAMTIQAYSGTTLKETYDLYWNKDGSYNDVAFQGTFDKWGWIYGANTAELQAPAVPEPMSFMLGIMGLSSVAGFRKLRKK